MIRLQSFFCLSSLALVTSALVFDKRSVSGPVISSDFADPSVIQVGSTWYAFATGNYGYHVQVATSPDFKTWTVQQIDALPDLPSWVVPDTPTGSFVWAPDVVTRSDGKFILYYSATYAGYSPSSHCVGAAISEGTDPKGPYTAQTSPLACPLSQGGAIDPSGFTDTNGTPYVVYKIDGNNIGHGGSCNNGVAPLVSTPIMLQQLESDLMTPVGSAIELLDRGAADGPLIEAPSINYSAGTYYLFFSSNCYSTTLYDVSWATATSVKGPWTKAGAPNAPLMVTGTDGLTSPGGATVTPDGTKIVFHAYINGDVGGNRGMWTGLITESAGVVKI